MQPSIILPPEPKDQKLIFRPLVLADTGVFLCNDFNILSFYFMFIFLSWLYLFLNNNHLFSQILIKTMIQWNFAALMSSELWLSLVKQQLLLSLIYQHLTSPQKIFPVTENMSQIFLAQNFLQLNGIWSWFYWVLQTCNKNHHPFTLKNWQNKLYFISTQKTMAFLDGLNNSKKSYKHKSLFQSSK